MLHCPPIGHINQVNHYFHDLPKKLSQGSRRKPKYFLSQQQKGMKHTYGYLIRH